MWIVGGWARLFGTDLAPVSALMAGVAVAILGLHAYLVSRTVPARLAPWVTAASLVLALALAQRESASLMLGMYTPAASIGGLLLLAALAIRFVPDRVDDPRRNVALGLLCGAMVLTKHDFWLPAAFLVIASRSGAAAMAALFTVATGALAIGLTAGIAVLPQVVTGFGHAQEFGMYGLPDWEGLTVAAIATLLCAVGIAHILGARPRYRVILLAAATVLMALHLAMSARHGIASTPAALLLHLARRLSTQLPPILLPAVLWVVVASWRLRLSHATWLLAALAFCIVARARRGFFFTEWYHVLLEVPVYVIALLAMAPGTRTSWRLRTGLAAVLAFGIAAEWSLGRPAFVPGRRLPALDTPRGVVHWRPYEADQMRWLASELEMRDPAGTRPIFAFRYSGGYSYFLQRPAAAGTTLGFLLSRFRPDSLVLALRRHQPSIFALDTRDLDSLRVRRPGVPLASWLWPTRLNHYVRFDRPYFQRLLVGCRPVSTFPTDDPILTLYDCD
jgi:hypothetical protein